MARSGVYKSDVMKARDSLLSQGKNPSIDAVRAELGNTGSKTTIHRYLRELEQEEGLNVGKTAAVSEAVQDLVDRLAARLHEEANTRIQATEEECNKALAQRDETIARQTLEITELNAQLQRTELAFHAERREHEASRQALLDTTVLAKQLEQQVSGLNERVAEHELHRQSLEEKHQHAREGLEHYRQSVKDQRDQEQRRHEQQVQQLQAELRNQNQTMIVKQDELTRLYQELAKVTAEHGAAKKDLRRLEAESDRSLKINNELRSRMVSLETTAATLTERLRQTDAIYGEVLHSLEEKTRLAQLQDVELIQARTQLTVQADLMAAMNKTPGQTTKEEKCAEQLPPGN